MTKKSPYSNDLSANHIAVLGGGSWGSALAILAAQKADKVHLWVRDARLANHINDERRNIKYLGDCALDDNIVAQTDLDDIFHKNMPIICAIPVQYMRKTLENISPNAKLNNRKWILCSKGIEGGTNLFPSQIIGELFPNDKVAMLSGPNFAKEVAAGLPAASMVAGHADCHEVATTFLAQRSFRLYYHDNIRAVEICAALKNVIAIACGICEGCGLGKNAHAALMTRGLAEMHKLCEYYASPSPSSAWDIISSLAGVGDLALTCQNLQSRNMAFGEKLGKGLSVREAEAQSKGVCEGQKTAKPLMMLAKAANIDLPISMEVYRIIYEEKPIKMAINDLLSRPQ
jgi:glycerol-3-phosphate dehydrogenase (NAD(P)+)